MATFSEILYWINNLVIISFMLAFGIQIMYILLFFLKPKNYKEAQEKHKFAILIPAKNEQEVIKRSVEKIYSVLDYPRDKYDVIVIADNCTDKTKEFAMEAGAIVLERNDTEKVSKGYALNFAIDYLFQHDMRYESYCIFDADTIPDADYLNKMNDAFESGVTIATCFLSSQNFTQNLPASISSLWYLRDSRFTCNTRSALGLPNMLGGHGIMIADSVLEEIGGWDSVGLLEDAEFSVNRILEGRDIAYVSEAIIYDDNPSKLKDVFKRNIRMGNGLKNLFNQKGGALLKKFFSTFRYRYLDIYLTILFAPIAVLAVIWFPTYYIFDFIYKANTDWTAFLFSIDSLWQVMVYAFYIPFVLQGWLALLLERKKLQNENKWKLFGYSLLLPFYMIIYALGITIGVLSKKVEWKNISRNVSFVEKNQEKDCKCKNNCDNEENNNLKENLNDSGSNLSQDNVDQNKIIQKIDVDIIPPDNDCFLEQDGDIIDADAKNIKK